MVEWAIYYFFAITAILIRSRRRRREKYKKRRERRFSIWPLFTDRATSGAYQNLVRKPKEMDKKFWVCSHFTESIWPFIRTYKAYNYKKECS